MKKFTKKTENFTCEHCGAEVVGDGYTNHCPKCLWSKHVDDNPGDRLEECGAMMRPVDLYKEHQDWIIVHECERCSTKRNDHIRDEDDFDEVLRLMKEINDKKVKELNILR